MLKKKSSKIVYFKGFGHQKEVRFHNSEESIFFFLLLNQINKNREMLL
jgi:hypothetical protein